MSSAAGSVGQEPGARWRLLAWLLPSLAAGMVIRLWGLSRQILGGDELHAVRAVLELSLPEILYTYRPQDACLPLSGLYRLLLISPLPFSEMTMRAPILLSAALTLVLAPWLLRRWLPTSTLVLFGWLLAISPILALYGRIVRSYAPVVLISFAAVMVFYRWLEAPSRRRAGTYVLLAGLAVYFHLVVTAFVLAPLLFAALERLFAARRQGWSRGEIIARLRPLFLLGAGVVVSILLFLVPGWSSLGPMIGEKRQLVLPNAATFTGVSKLQSGSTQELVALVFYAFALVGLVVLVRRRRRFGLYTLTLVIGHGIGMVVLRPLNLHLPPQFTRYNLVVLPILLLWVAAALTLPWSRRGALRVLQGGLATAFVLALVLTSPLLQPAYRTSDFTHHKDFLGFYAPRGQLAVADVSPFYLQLASGERSGAVLEYPWHTSWRLSRTPYILQLIHHQPVYVAPMQGMLWDSRLDFRKMIPGRPRVFLKSPARWLLIHPDFGSEEDRVDGDHRSPKRGWKLRGREWDWLAREGGAMARRLTAQWGPPDYRDDTLLAWDLDRIRKRP